MNVNKTDKENKKGTELNVEAFKYFGTPRKSKSSRKRNLISPIIILPQMRKSRLKSEIYVENMENVLPDGEYDISKENFDSSQIQTPKPSKISPKKENNIQSNAAQKRRRSTRLKCEILDRSCISLSDDENVVTSAPVHNLELKTLENDANVNTSINSNKINENHKNQEIPEQELDENFVDSINADAIADILLITDTHVNKELEKFNTSKIRRTTTAPSESNLDNNLNKNYKYSKRPRKNRNIRETENRDIHMKHNIQGHIPKTNHEAKNAKDFCLRTTRSSSQGANNISNGKLSEANDSSKETVKNINEVLNNSKTETNNNTGLMKYFKVQNKQFDKKSYYKNSKVQESLVQNSELIPDSSVTINSQLKKSNNQKNSPGKRGRGRPPLSAQAFSKNNSSKQPGIKKYTKVLTTSRNVPEDDLVNHAELIPEHSVSNDLKIKKSNDQQNSIQMPAKRCRGRPKLSAQTISKNNVSTQSGIKKYTKIIPTSKAQIKNVGTRNVKKNGVLKPTLTAKGIGKYKYTKISKLTKEHIKNVTTRKIPKDRLDDVLSMMDDENHIIWDDRNTSCNPYIFNHWNTRNLNSEHNMKIKYARQFLLRRDWIRLSKILGLFNTTARVYYPLLAKYATLLLAHTDKEQFNKLIQFLTNFDDSSAVIKKCTKIPTVNDESV